MQNGVKKIRLKLGMTQNAFATAIGKTQSAVANYEACGPHHRTPDLNTAWSIIDLAKKKGLPASLEDVYPRH
jgi:DNA-binding XRE family transcriptional regulator